MERGARVANGARKDELLRRLHDAEQRCARRKQSRPDAIALRANRAERLIGLADQLAAGQWRPAPGLVFVTTRPKHREVHAARYSDRVVHHLIVQDLAPAIDRRLCPNTFACREGKGTHAAVRALRESMWSLSRHGKVRVWALQMDVVNFFHTIDRERLWALLQRPLREAVATRDPPYDLATAVRALLDDEPARRAARVGNPQAFARVPPHKRLSQQAPGRGLPIGNLTSQWFANAYLAGLDAFVQRELGLGHYVRYMDDFVVLGTDAARLERARAAIIAMLRERLGLAVHASRPLQLASRGIDFCGAIIRPAYALPRRRVVAAWSERLQAAAAAIRPIVVEPGRTVGLAGFGRVAGPCAIWPLAGTALSNLRAAWASGAGCTRHARSRNLHSRMWRRTPALGRFLARRRAPLALRHADATAFSAGRVFSDWRSQRDHLLKLASGAVAIVRVGRNVELVRRRDCRRCAAGAPRFRWPYARLPAECSGRWVQAALDGRNEVLLVGQLPGYHGRVRARAPL
ncbi:MAG: hypothetical protein FJ100_23470, partial [Deltaproteobacteria bacterium]|nr:hypothetical protein [Deltaproteobacteria bacterium]